MQGAFRTVEERRAYSEQWAREVVPGLMFAEIEPLRPLLKRTAGLVSVDVGANKGFWAKALLRTFGDAVSAIHLVDASPENYRELSNRQNNMIFESADFPKLHPHHTALGSTRGTVTLYTNDDGSPLASLYEHRLNGYSSEGMAAVRLTKSLRVPMETLDDFLQTRNIRHVDILKIDVEGHEWEVINGAMQALKDKSVDLLSFEFGLHQIEARHFFSDFYQLFTGLGYRMHMMQSGISVPVNRYEYKYENFTDNFNFIAERVTDEMSKHGLPLPPHTRPDCARSIASIEGLPDRHVNTFFYRAYYNSDDLTDRQIFEFFRTAASRSFFANENEFLGEVERKRLLPPGFHPLNYIIANRDLWHIQSDWAAMLHYLRSGAAEGRSYQRPFDPAYYRAMSFPDRGSLRDEDLREHWLSSNASGYGSLGEALLRNGFTSTTWIDNFRHWVYVAHNYLGDLIRNETQAIVHFITVGCAQLLPIGPGAVFDPQFCLEFSGGQPGLSDADLYKVWIQVSKLTELPPNESQFLRSLDISLPSVPNGFLWESYVAGSAKPANKWSAFQHFVEEGVLASQPLPLTHDCAATVLAAIADRYVARGRLSEAERIYDRALLYNAHIHPRVFQLAGDLALRRERFERAIQLYREVERRSAQTLWTYANTADAALQCGDLGRARQRLQAGFAAHPRSPHLHERLREYLEKSYDLATSRHIEAMRMGSPEAELKIRADLHRIYREAVEAYRAELAISVSPTRSRETAQKRSDARPPRTSLRVVLLANMDLPQCTHYRVAQKQEQLASTDIHLRVLDRDAVGDFMSAVSTADAAIFYRVAATVDVMRCLAYCELNGIPTFYDVDDLVFETEYFPEELAAYAGTVTEDEHFSLRSGAPLVKVAIELCDYGIASTKRLGSHLSPLVRKSRVIVHRNALCNSLYAAARGVSATSTRESNARLLIFYGSATKAHARDFDLQIVPAIMNLMSQDERVLFLAVGFVELTSLANAFPDRVEHIPLVTDREAYLSLLAEADINIAVLQQNEFNDCKSEIKWLEAAALGIPSVISGVIGMQEELSNGKDVIVCGPTPADWLAALKSLTEDATHRQSIGTRARSKALELYRPDVCGRRLESSLRRLLGIADESVGRKAVKKRPSRILVVNVFFPPQALGGATRVVADQVEMIKEYYSAFEVAVFCSNNEEVVPYQLERYSWRGVTVYSASVPHREHMDWVPYDHRMESIFDEVIDAFVPDLVHFHCVQRLTCAVVERTAARGIPFIVTVHDAWWISDHQFLMDGHNQLKMPWQREDYGDGANPHTHADSAARRLRLASCLAKARAVVSVSDSFAKVYQESGVQKVVAIPNGVSKLPPLIATEPPPGSLRIAHIGGTAYHKGFFLLQDTIARGAYQKLELLVVDPVLDSGEERYERWGTTLVRAIGPVPQEKIGWLYGQFEVLLVPSIWPESFGLVVREALAYGRWVVASSWGATAEAITHGQNGIVIDLSKPDAIAEALAMLERDIDQYRQPPSIKFATRTVNEQVADLCSLYERELSAHRDCPSAGPRPGA